MTEAVNRDNIVRLHENQKMLVQKIDELTERLARTENNLEIMRAELQNAKQMNAFLAGRGLGGTSRH